MLKPPLKRSHTSISRRGDDDEMLTSSIKRSRNETRDVEVDVILDITVVMKYPGGKAPLLRSVLKGLMRRVLKPL